MDEVVEQIAGLSLADAALLVESNLAAHYAYMQAIPGSEFGDNEVLTWFRSSVPQPFFNVVVRAHLPSEVADATIAVVVRNHRERGMPLRWWVGPSAPGPEFGRLLSAQGATHVMDSFGMAVDLDTLPGVTQVPDEFEIKLVDTPERLDQYCQAFTAGFRVPALDGQQRFDAFDPLVWIASARCATMLAFWLVSQSRVRPSSSVAGRRVYHIAVAPTAQRRGIGAAMTVAPLRDARVAGYRVGILQAIPPAERVYERVGFRTCCLLGVYQWT